MIWLDSTPTLKENTMGVVRGTSHLSSPSINLRIGLGTRWLLRAPPCHKGTIQHPCLLGASNPGPIVQQSASPTTIPDER
ncbi:hypothetical protein TNCV_4876401 [Trichonephila clavipes]|uniref:Uncharacterized protein n=1 Tax=Trichonephila clavipes TaxID=2585209 RepID=A0A8X6RD42_TRICX|nr:hypothetical protein TNCV_4876401 [Trichonephila clavipes]